MKYVIIFNQTTSWKWKKGDLEHNKYCLKDMCQHLTNVLKWRGYVYLNQVYEHVGVSWNPDDDNPVFRHEPCGSDPLPVYNIEEGFDGYVLTINY